MHTYTLTVLVVGVLAAAYSDVRTRRIPNLLTGALAALAVAFHLGSGISGVAGVAAVMVVAFGVGTIAFSLGWFGGGDVKLMAACCGLAGFPGALSLLLYTLMAGGILSLFEAARRHRLRSVLTGTFMLTTGQSPGAQTAVPYGIAIAAGACTYVLSLTTFQFLRLPL